MTILKTLIALHLTAFSCVCSRGPLGPITFTALSKTSINIQVDRGDGLEPYEYFSIKRDNWETACNIPIYATLTDCTDGHARQGSNEYHIGARSESAVMMPIRYYADSLQKDPSQELLPQRHTETAITVSYNPEAGVSGSRIVARNGKVGRFLGHCDAALGTCTVSGLSAGFIYDIWVRTCSGSGPARCILRAMPTQMVTYPRAPTGVEVSPKTTTSVDVAISDVDQNTDVSFYEAGYQRKFCSVQAGDTPLICSLVQLSPGTRYRVHVVACMASFECSYRHFAEGFTLPDEPKEIRIDGVNTTNFRVSFQGPAGNRDINRYELSMEGGCIVKTCTLDRTASPLQCQFRGLQPATKYTVNIRSCLPNSIGCSGNATILAVTTPDEPKNINFEDITHNAVSVKVEEPKEDNAVRHYEAFVKGGSKQQACIIHALADPLVCTIRGLTAGHNYTVGVKACAFGNHGCGTALEKSFRTES